MGLGWIKRRLVVGFEGVDGDVLVYNQWTVGYGGGG